MRKGVSLPATPPVPGDSYSCGKGLFGEACIRSSALISVEML